MKIYLIIIIVILLGSCDDRNSDVQFDFNLAQEIIRQNNLQDLAMLILESKQGIFAFANLSLDTCNISYSGLGIGKVIMHPDSLKGYWDNLYKFEETPGLFELTSNWGMDNLAGIPVLTNSQIKNHLIKSGTEDTYTFNWDKLEKMGVKKLCSFSDSIINEKEKKGYSGFQIYSRENFAVNVVYFDFAETLIIDEFKKMNFKILDLKCSFSNGILTKLEPNKMIVN